MGFNKTWAWIIGIVLLLVGITGFFTGDSVLGFPVNTLHNIVHVVTGLIFIWAAWKTDAKKYNKWLGIIYLLVAILGFLGLLGFLNVSGGNDPDNWLHIGIGLISFLVGWKAS